MKCKGMEGLGSSEVEKYSLGKVELLWTRCTLKMLFWRAEVGLKWRLFGQGSLRRLGLGLGVMLRPE